MNRDLSDELAKHFAGLVPALNGLTADFPDGMVHRVGAEIPLSNELLDDANPPPLSPEELAAFERRKAEEVAAWSARLAALAPTGDDPLKDAAKAAVLAWLQRGEDSEGHDYYDPELDEAMGALEEMLTSPSSRPPIPHKRHRP